jgi:hypothetical protein
MRDSFFGFARFLRTTEYAVSTRLLVTRSVRI